MLPLMFFYDFKSTGESKYEDHVIEVRRCKSCRRTLLTEISQLEYSSLVPSPVLCFKAVQDKCGISDRMFVNKPSFCMFFISCYLVYLAPSK